MRILIFKFSLMVKFCGLSREGNIFSLQKVFIYMISEDIGSLSAVNGVKPLGVCAISGPYFITGELSLQNNDFLLSFNGRFSNSNY